MSTAHSNFTLERLRDEIDRSELLRAAYAHARVRDDDVTHAIDHLERVALWTVRISANREPLHRAVLCGLLHDFVRIEKSSPDRARASTRSAEGARAFLIGLGAESDDADAVADAISTHSFSAGRTPNTFLGAALQDADRLDALGSIGTIRCLLTGPRMNARPFDVRDPFAVRRALDDRRFSIDHFFVKLFTLPTTLHTDIARVEAARRIEAMTTFLDNLCRELEALDA